MRRITIDFNLPARRAPASRPIVTLLWTLGLGLAAWEFSEISALLAERRQLEKRMQAQSSAGKAAVVDATQRRKAEQAIQVLRAFDPALLTAVERAVDGVRRPNEESPEPMSSRADRSFVVRGLVFDARQQRLVLRGETRHSASVDRFHTALRAALPGAVVSFPSVTGATAAGSTSVGEHTQQFDLSVRWPKPPGAL